jgi:hypothetical protein
MTAAKNVYALMLALIIVLSGCFGATTDDSDAQDSGANSGNGDGTSSADNLPPVILVSGPSSYSWEPISDSNCTTVGFSTEVRHSMTDWDGTIANAGWDTNLDGNIDFPVTDSQGYTMIEVSIEDGYDRSTSETSWYGGDDFEYTRTQNYLEHSVVFGVQDDDGEWTSSGIFLTTILSSTTYDVISFSNNYINSYGEFLPSSMMNSSSIDNIPCADFEDPTDYTFTLADDPDIVSTGHRDYLVTISRTNGAAPISWDQLGIWFDGDNEGAVSCYTYRSSYNDCYIIQEEGNDMSTWEAGETIRIQEWDGLHSGWEDANVQIMFKQYDPNGTDWDWVEIFEEDIELN